MAAEEVAQAGFPAAASAADHKRKLDDLNVAVVAPEPEVPGGDGLGVKDNGVEDDGGEGALAGAAPAHGVEGKRPRIDLEADASDLGEAEEEDKFESVSDGNELSPDTESVGPPVEAGEGQIQPSVEGTQPDDDNHAQDTSLAVEGQHFTEESLEEDIPGNERAKLEPASQEIEVPNNEDTSTIPISLEFTEDSTDEDIHGNEKPKVDGEPTSRKIEVPNNKVGVLIGKAGETIRFLQYNSGAKIQITRDADADLDSSMRSVELIGSFESVIKAEQLIKDVISEADAGGSPALVARGFGASHTGSDQVQIQVPNEKVGLIIGKGGETIKNLQTKSGARIQLIPQHLPEGDLSKERTVRVTGSKRQIEIAREMIKEAMNQTSRPSSHPTGYGHHGFQSRGPAGPSPWSHPRGQSHMAQQNYNYPQRGMYSSQPQHYPPQAYGGYSHHAGAPRSNFNPGWEQRSLGPMQGLPHGGGYDYYGQGGPPHGANLGHAPSQQPSGQPNYPYGHPQGPEFGQPPSYYHSTPSFHQGYDNQAPTQPSYGSSQPGFPQQHHGPSSSAQPPYNKPAYGIPPSQGVPPQSYGMPRPGQSGDMPSYQGPPASNPAYGPTGAAPMHQQFPYGSSATSQQPYPYAAAPTANDGYGQSAPGQAPAYGQQVGGNASYGQGVATQPAYAQGGQQPATYAQYPSVQPGYGEQAAPVNASYGAYQGTADASAYNASGGAYGATASGNQAGYGQPSTNPPTNYEQPVQQANYGTTVAPAPVG